MATATQSWTGSRLVTATLVTLAVACGAVVVYKSATALVGLFVAIVLSRSMRPAVEWLVRQGVPRWMGALAVHLGLLVLACAFLLVVLPVIIAQSAQFLATLPEFYAGSRAHLLASSSGALDRLVRHLPRSLPDAGPAASTGTLDTLAHLSSIQGLGRILFLCGAVVALGFFWTVDGEATLAKAVRLAPRERREGLRAFLESAQDKMGRFVWGQAIICAAAGALSTGVYAALGLPHALVLGLIAGVLDAVPLLGPIAGMLPAAFIAFAIRPSLALWVVAAYFAIHMIETYVVAPRVMGKTVGVNPLVTLLAISAFGALLGLTGVFLAIPIAAVLQLVLERVIEARRAVPVAEAGEPATTGGVRTEVTVLIGDVRRLVHHDKGGVHEDPRELESDVEAIAADLDRIIGEIEAAMEMP